MTQFVDYHRTKQWDGVYDMLAERSKESHEGGLPKDVFLVKELYSSVRRFTPRTVKRMDTDDAWMISGCATYDRGDAIDSALQAYLENGEWFFSDIWGDFPCVDCKPRDCKH